MLKDLFELLRQMLRITEDTHQLLKFERSLPPAKPQPLLKPETDDQKENAEKEGEQ